LLKEFATRKRTGFMESIYKALPDPDKILEENNYDFEIYRDLLNDPHLMATIQQRKMQVMQMGWELTAEEEVKTEVKENVFAMLRRLPLGKIMSDVLDAIFFGYSVGEIEWRKEGKYIVPVDIIGKPQEWFIFTKNNELRLRKYNHGVYLFEEGEKLPEFKFILTQYNPTY